MCQVGSTVKPTAKPVAEGEGIVIVEDVVEDVVDDVSKGHESESEASRPARSLFCA